jgi:hypothetical protein
MPSVRNKTLSFFLVLSFLFASQANSAGLAISDYTKHNKRSMPHVVDCHIEDLAIAIGCIDHAALSAKFSSNGNDGCCIGVFAVLPTAHFFWKDHGVEHAHQALSAAMMPPLRAETIYRPPRPH